MLFLRLSTFFDENWILIVIDITILYKRELFGGDVDFLHSDISFYTDVQSYRVVQLCCTTSEKGHDKQNIKSEHLIVSASPFRVNCLQWLPDQWIVHLPLSKHAFHSFSLNSTKKIMQTDHESKHPTTPHHTICLLQTSPSSKLRKCLKVSLAFDDRSFDRSIVESLKRFR